MATEGAMACFAPVLSSGLVLSVLCSLKSLICQLRGTETRKVLFDPVDQKDRERHRNRERERER